MDNGGRVFTKSVDYRNVIDCDQKHHGLPGTVSPVLTVTGFVNIIPIDAHCNRSTLHPLTLAYHPTN